MADQSAERCPVSGDDIQAAIHTLHRIKEWLIGDSAEAPHDPAVSSADELAKAAFALGKAEGPLPEDEERKAFEAWADEKGTFGFSWNGEVYVNTIHLQAAWNGWLARARAGRKG